MSYPSEGDDEIGEEKVKWLRELLKDAETSARLSQWEESFADDMRERVFLYGERTRVTPRQMEVLCRIERVLYQ